ncbi:LysR family transcriptional regulator [Longirhabdus pacifica]|uniref:LysR family transcriptional regulator n=1 Tax=Longirhabdus pacifica TaxID=2305227 RepID=UPI001008B02E|nr:LysR family transcriptional regulator [Longirhabdus pacifica]
MELRHMRYVLNIAEQKNFSRAAEQLHIAQPSLSQQLAKLESELGVTLFKRSTNRVELTPAGEVFIKRSEKILDLVLALTNELEDMSGMKKGKLTIGSLPITGSYILPKVLPSFQQRYPGIEINLVEEASSTLEQLLTQGKVDICLLTLPIQEPSLSYKPLITEEIYLALPEGHALHSHSENTLHERVSIRKLKEEPFIVLKQGQGFRNITLSLCRQAGFEPNIVFESSNIETVQALVAAGMGIAFVPDMIRHSQRGDLVPHYSKIEGAPTRTIVIGYQQERYLSKAATTFIDEIREQTL